LGARLVPVAERTARAIRPALVVAASSVALLLVVATANASTLLVARASSRRHELAVRAALGATRARLLSLSMAESLVFACVGGLTGLVLGHWALRGLIPLFAESLPPSLSIDVGGRAALFTAGLTFRVALTGSRYAAMPARARFVSHLLERLTATAGVRAEGLTSLVPFGGMRGANTVEIEGRTPMPGEPPLIIDQRHVSPGYFQ